MSLMPGVFETHGHISEVEGHMARGGSRALPHREAGLEPLDMWRYQSPVERWSWCLRHVVTSEPSYVKDGTRATRHVVTLKPSPTGWWARCHGVHGDAKALCILRRV
jgi:hypothetical protein